MNGYRPEAALLTEVESLCTRSGVRGRCQIETYPQCYQLPDAVRSLSDDNFNNVRIAEPVSGCQSVADVKVK